MEVRFVTSAAELSQRPEPVLPEIAFVGRSNCGKSSLLNLYLGRRDLARTSGKPGKTQLMNYFLVEERYYLVDLPGYGFARVSKVRRAAWRELFRRFLQAQERPLAVFQLLDARHKPSAEDCEVNGWLEESGHPYALATTKTDKVGTNSRAARFQEIIHTLGVRADTPFFPTSARLGTGREEMRAWVEALLAAADGDMDSPPSGGRFDGEADNGL